MDIRQRIAEQGGCWDRVRTIGGDDIRRRAADGGVSILVWVDGDDRERSWERCDDRVDERDDCWDIIREDGHEQFGTDWGKQWACDGMDGRHEHDSEVRVRDREEQHRGDTITEA